MKANSLGLIIIAGAVFFMLGRPQLADLESLNQQKEAYRKSIEEMNRIEDMKNALLTKLESVSAEDLQKINTVLPDKPNIVVLVSEIDSIASKRGIQIRNINTESRGNFAAVVGESAPQKDYESLGLSFDFDSNYDSLKAFLFELESSMRLVDVRAIDFETSDKSGTQNYKISLDLYWASAPQSSPGIGIGI